MAQENTQMQNATNTGRHSGTGSYWDVLSDFKNDRIRKEMESTCDDSFGWLAKEEKVPDVAKGNHFEGLKNVVRLIDTCYPYNDRNFNDPTGSPFLSSRLYGDNTLEQINKMYKNDFKNADEVIMRAAIGLCFVDYTRQIELFALSEDPKEKIMEQLVAMTAIGQFLSSATKTINDLVPGRAHPEIPFLEDEGLEDKEPARSCYKNAREKFYKECNQIAGHPYTAVSTFCGTCRSFDSKRSQFSASLALPGAKAEGLSLYQENLLFLEALEDTRLLIGQERRPEESFLNLGNYNDYMESVSNLCKCNDAIIAAKCAKAGISLLKGGISERTLKDINDAYDLKVVDPGPGEKPKRPNAWVRTLNKLGFYKDTMAKYRQDLAEYTARNEVNPTLDPIIDAGVMVGTAAAALRDELYDRIDSPDPYVGYVEEIVNGEEIVRRTTHLNALPGDDKLDFYLTEPSKDSQKAASAEEVNPVSLEDLIQSQPEKAAARQTPARDNAKEMDAPQKQHQGPSRSF